jgi:hypothetical protein
MVCGWFGSRCLQRVPANLFLASSYLGAVAGLVLGVLYGVVVAVASAVGGYGLALGGFAIVTGCLVGALAGLAVGMLNGIVLAVLSHTPVLRARSGVSRNRVTGAAVVTTCLGSLAVLYPLLESSGWILTYPPVIAATLTAIPLSRKLRLP